MEWSKSADGDARVDATATDVEPRPAVSSDAQLVVNDLERAASVIGETQCAHLWLHDSATRTYRQIAWHGTVRTVSDPIPQNEGPISVAIADRRPALATNPDAPYGDPAAGGWRYAIPVWSRTDSGAAVIDFSGRRPEQSSLDRLAESFDIRLSAALALHIARDEASTMGSLVRAMNSLAGIVDPSAAANELLEQAVSLFDAHTGSVMLLRDDGSGLRIVASRGLPRGVTESTVVGPGEGVSGWVLTTSKPVVIEDIKPRGPQGRRHGIRSAISVPIFRQGETVGVLNVGSRCYPGRSMDRLLDALQNLADMGGRILFDAEASVSTRTAYFETLQALVSALETKDPYAHGATGRVVDITTALGRHLGLEPADAEALRIASLLHDIGMDAAGDVVAISGRPLSTVEHTLLKMHPVIAADILRQAPALTRVVPIVYHHHEHYDGHGYMAGLSGDRIPMGARILAVADAYVAMTSERPYRHAMSETAALQELHEGAGTQFDPSVVEAFKEIRAEKHERPPLGTTVEMEL